MGNVINYSERRVYVGCALTSALVLALWALTHSIGVTLVSLFLIPWAMMKIVHKQVTIRGKVVAVIVIAILFAISAIFFRNKEDIIDQTEDPGIVIQDEDVTEEQENNEDKTEDDSATVENQKVSTSSGKGRKSSGSAKPKATEVLTPNYSNVGGNSSGGNGEVNKGSITTTGSDETTITSQDNTADQHDNEIQNDVNNGKDKTDLDNGVEATTGKTTPEDNQTKDTTVKDGTVVVPSSDEPEKIPEQLPENEQLKKDVENPTEDLLDQMVDTTETTDKDDTFSTETPKQEENENKEEDENKGETENKEDSSSTEIDSKKDEVKQDENVDNDSDSNKNDKPVEETTETVKTPVTITPLDGNTAIAGDSVQFKVTGDVKTIEGLDGFNYTHSNGYITVYTASDEATVITPTVIGADGVSTATTMVTVSVLNNN